jgi:hypothetical protein
MSDINPNINKLIEENKQLKEDRKNLIILINDIINKNNNINKLIEDKYNSLLYKLWIDSNKL